MRLFVAVAPDDVVRGRLSTLELGHVQGLRIVRPDRWHITLRFLGEVDEGVVPGLVDALRGAATSIRGPIRCELGPTAEWFSGERVLQIPAVGLDEVARAVRAATIPLVPASAHGEGSFTGHLTIARSKRGKLAVATRSALAGRPFTATFDVDSVDLVRSDLSHEGPRYATLATLSFAR
jgi:2'-5' RNA ligase